MNSEEIDMDYKLKEFTEILYNNFGIGSMHIELNVSCMAIIPNIEAMDYEFLQFIGKISEQHIALAYVATMKKLQAGIYRCHMLCNPDVSEDILNLWHNGSVRKDKINSFNELDEFIEILVSDMRNNCHMRSKNLRIIKEI